MTAGRPGPAAPLRVSIVVPAARIGRLAVLPATSTASARRFEEHGTLRLLAFMRWLKVLYFAGVDPAGIARRYAAGPPRPGRRHPAVPVRPATEYPPLPPIRSGAAQ